MGDFVRTDAVFTVDDDVLPSPGLVRCMLAAWARAPGQVLGLDLRRVGMVEKMAGKGLAGRGLHSSTSQLNLSRI